MDSIFTITVPGFIFFLLIVSVGYVATGDLSTKSHRGSLERLIWYVMSGIIINLLFILIIGIIPGIKDILIRYSTKLGESVNLLGINNETGVFVILFSLGYFIVILLLAYILRPMFKRILPRRF